MERKPSKQEIEHRPEEETPQEGEFRSSVQTGPFRYVRRPGRTTTASEYSDSSLAARLSAPPTAKLGPNTRSRTRVQPSLRTRAHPRTTTPISTTRRRPSSPISQPAPSHDSHADLEDLSQVHLDNVDNSGKMTPSKNLREMVRDLKGRYSSKSTPTETPRSETPSPTPLKREVASSPQPLEFSGPNVRERQNPPKSTPSQSVSPPKKRSTVKPVTLQHHSEPSTLDEGHKSIQPLRQQDTDVTPIPTSLPHMIDHFL